MKNYVKEFKGYKVPEGAVYYNEGCGIHQEGFWSERDDLGKAHFISTKGGRFTHKKFNLPNIAIELPEAEQVWMPEVGVECEAAKYSFCLHWSKCVVNFFGKRKCIITFKDGSEEAFITKDMVFRPLKTQEEKEREEFIDKSLSMWNEDCISPSELVEKMFDHGARFTEVDK